MEIDSDWSKQKPRDLPPRAHRINCRAVISSNYLPGNLKLNFVFCFFFSEIQITLCFSDRSAECFAHEFRMSVLTT